MRISDELKQMLDENIVYLATSTEEGKPNVVPIGLLPAIGDEELLIVDLLFTDLFNDMVSKFYALLDSP